MLNRKIFYILPCYNESLNLNKLLKDFTNFFATKNKIIKIIIVDDGSKDNSIEVINRFKKKNFYKNISIKILKHKKNMGLGKALKTGFEHCFLNGKNDDILISMDTDNSHTINLSYKMANKIILNEYDVIIASRYKKNSKITGLNFMRKFLSLGAALLYKIFFPIKNVIDYTSGFRAFKLEPIRSAWKLNKNFFSEKGFSASADILLKLYKHKLSFFELPIDLRYDLKKGESKMKIINTIYLNIALIIKRKLFS
jgi:dolichol-phosphate mannosyltransferase